MTLSLSSPVYKDKHTHTHTDTHCQGSPCDGRHHCMYCGMCVKPLMFTFPLFREFRDLNKTAKLKGVNIYTLIYVLFVLELCALNSPT